MRGLWRVVLEEWRRVPDDEDVTFPQRFGIVAVRGCMVLEVKDEEGTVLSDPAFGYQQRQQQQNNNSNGASTVKTKANGHRRFLRVALDPAQYAADATGGGHGGGGVHGSPLGTNVYKLLNLVVRRHGRENSFKAVLETIHGLMVGTRIDPSVDTELAATGFVGVRGSRQC